MVSAISFCVRARRLREGFTTRVQGILNLLFGLVDHCARGGRSFGRQGSRPFICSVKALFTQMFDPDFVEGGGVVHALTDSGPGLADYFSSSCCMSSSSPLPEPGSLRLT